MLDEYDTINTQRTQQRHQARNGLGGILLELGFVQLRCSVQHHGDLLFRRRVMPAVDAAAANDHSVLNGPGRRIDRVGTWGVVV